MLTSDELIDAMLQVATEASIQTSFQCGQAEPALYTKRKVAMEMARVRFAKPQPKIDLWLLNWPNRQGEETVDVYSRALAASPTAFPMHAAPDRRPHCHIRRRKQRDFDDASIVRGYTTQRRV